MSPFLRDLLTRSANELEKMEYQLRHELELISAARLIKATQEQANRRAAQSSRRQRERQQQRPALRIG
jgi:hypothetical protein